jgi:hypothetical protein
MGGRKREKEKNSRLKLKDEFCFLSRNGNHNVDEQAQIRADPRESSFEQ